MNSEDLCVWYLKAFLIYLSMMTVITIPGMIATIFIKDKSNLKFLSERSPFYDYHGLLSAFNGIRYTWFTLTLLVTVRLLKIMPKLISRLALALSIINDLFTPNTGLASR